jgi:predicted nuclease of predicted toxin-antitoxin system
MALRFFTAHCVANSVVTALTAAGHDVMKLRDHLPTNSPDPVVIAEAQTRSSILLSLNGDFADIVSYPPAHYQRIVALRVRNHPELTSQVTARLLDYLRLHPDARHYTGKLLVVEAHQIRVRSS